VSVVANLAINVDSSGAVSKLKQVQQGAQATSQAVDKLNATNNALAASFTKSGKPIQTAANGMRFFTDATGRARKVNGQFVTTAEAAAAGLQKQGRAAQQTAGKLNGLRSAVVGLGSAFGGIAAVLGVIQAGRFVFAKTAEVESQSRSLAILAGSAEKAGQIIKELQDLGAVTPFTSTELIDSAKRLQAFGVEADKVVETTRRLADASGATGAELSGLVTAYGQVQAKGRLQGEELLQFQERGIALQEELRKMYGMTGEEFQKALSKGQVSAKAVEVALVNLTSAGGKYANGAIAQSDTLQGRLSTLQDGVDALARRIGQVLTPALKAIFNQAIAVVDAINAALAAGRGGGFTRNVAGAKQFLNIGATSQAVDNIAKGVGQVSSQKNKSGIQQNLQALQQYQRLLQSIGADDPNAGRAVQLQGEILTKINQNLAAQKQLQSGAKPSDKLFTPPLLGAAPTPTTATGTGTGAKKGSDDAERAAEEANRLAEQIREQTKAAESLKIQQQGSLAILRSSNDFEKAFVEFSVKRTEIQRRYSELTLASKSDEERKLLTEARALEFKQSSFELQKQIADLTKQATAPLDDIVSKLKDQVAFEREYGELIKNGTNPELAKQIIEINRAYEASAAALVPALAAAQAAVTRAEAEGASATEIQKYREELERIQEIQSGLPAKKTDAIGAATELAKPKTDQQNITEKIATLKKEITDLTSISNIAITSAEGIGNAFAQSFQGLISGSMTAKEALGSFFKSVADMFLEMAAQIIAKQITMIILQTILKALGGATGGGGEGLSSGFDAGSASALPTDSAGWSQSFATKLPGRAVGGPVTSQQPYMVGERGPELFVPGTGGSVVSNGDLRSAMNGGSGGASGSPVLNMSFQSTSINGVEYVSRDQLESAMAETRRNATRDGAKRGMTMTLDRIQNSSSTRRKVGI
jgi:tape measure domain-containing protein